ncbi:hypothetical protein HA402_008169 [Bradysia odoriphaga]|nr:hypothetical protein HA402_008169 [Bradysia odoriphaga]
MDRSFLTDNPKLVDEIVCEVKSQGVFDQFRRNCIADVDTKPAYQNLRQRVENIVSNFLSDQVWRPDLNKNQLREKLRKHITEAGFLETGVERIVDQVVNPKINSVFLPKIEDISYKYLGIEKPKPSNDQTLFKSEPLVNEDTKPPKNLPPVLDDLEAVSPDSSGSKKSFKDSTENLDTTLDPDSIKAELNDSGDKVDDDFESPAFEPLQGSLLNESDSINGEEDSKLSDISGLTSQDSVNSEQNCEQLTVIPEPEIKAPTIEVIEQPAVTQSQQVIPENINQDSVLSQVSSNSHLSIVTDSNNKSSEVDICEEAQMPKFSENSFNNPVVDDSERKPLLTVFDIKQDEIKFEGTERRSSLHNICDDVKLEEDIVMEELKESVPPADSIEDDSLIKTESSSSCIDPIINETKDLSLKDDGRSNETEFKFEEPVQSVDTTDALAGVSSSQNANDRHRPKDLKGERKSDSRSDHKSHRRDKDKSSHHSRDRHKDGKHSSSSSSKHSSSSSSSRKEHRSESREAKKPTSDHRRDDSSKSTDRSSGKSQTSSYSSSRDKDSNHKSSRSHEDRDKNRSKHDRSSNKSRTHHRDDKSTKRQSLDDDESDKKKPGQESETKPKTDDDHAVHHEKSFDRRRSTDRDSDDGTMERGKPTSSNRQVTTVNSSAITNSASSSSYSSASSCTDDYEKRGTASIQQIAADTNLNTSSTDSDDNFVPTSTPVVVDQILIGNDINLEMLMETNNIGTTDEMDPVMSMMQQSLSDDVEMKIKKPKVASNIFEARKLMKVRKQMEREQKKRLEKLLVHSKQMVGCNNVDEQGVELEFSVMNSSAPSISSPIKPKEVPFEGHQVPAPVNEKRNSGEFIIDMNEMKEMEKQLKKKKAEKQPPAPKFVHKFDEILSQIDKPRKRDSKGSQSPISPVHEKSPRSLTGLQDKPPNSEPMARKLALEQSKEPPAVDSKKLATKTSPPRQQRDEKKTERPGPVRSQDGNKSRKDSRSSKSPPAPLSPTKVEQKTGKPNRIPEKTVKSSNAAGSASTSKHEKVVTPTKPKVIKIDMTPKTTIRPEDIPKTRADSSTKSNIDFDEENEPEFFGFSELQCKAQLDYAKVKQILASKADKRTLHLLNYDKSMSEVFSQYSTNVIDVTGSVEKCVISEKLPPHKSTGVSQTRGVRKSTAAKNGVRTTPQSQHKLFIENNQFADTADVKQTSRKRRTSSAAQGSAAKIVRLVDSKVSGDEEETSPTPSEQSKENQIVQQIKKHNRTTEISCTSNAIDQQPGEKSETTKPNPNQRYASDDLYKPRPILSRTRRRGIENGET